MQLWLKQQAEHPKIQRLERHTNLDYGHIFRLDGAEDLDPGLIALLEESYAMSNL